MLANFGEAILGDLCDLGRLKRILWNADCHSSECKRRSVGGLTRLFRRKEGVSFNARGNRVERLYRK